MSITVENLTHIYNKGLAYETIALEDVSFTVPSGEFIAIIGHTGSGKSTLIQHLNGILKPTSGEISIGDIKITDKRVKMVDIRKRVGLVFQYPEYQLFEETVYQDISFGPKNLGLPTEEVDRRIRKSMQLVGLDFEEFAERSPFELSGGQKRRVAIAGVIAMEPEVLILDEPTAGLDPKSHQDILNMVEEVHRETKNTIVLVSHNMNDVAERADRVFIMDSGKLVKSGRPQEVFREREFLSHIGLGVPQTTEVAALLSERGFQVPEILLRADDLISFLAERLPAGGV
ncbi:MAG: energy-coupling factor transporter ATPase [Clostridiales Family XIII bacterium]|jgi:energy-coupling factor transport system ATP-binding protein|nr:energy-coupling factor transporter ATPase [Clostridiales Family XIII bacterium]